MSDVQVDNSEFPPRARQECDEELVARLLEIRPTRVDLTDEQFIKEAGFLIIQNRVTPILQDAIGLNGEENQAGLFPLSCVLAQLAHTITSDFVALHEGMGD